MASIFAFHRDIAVVGGSGGAIGGDVASRGYHHAMNINNVKMSDLLAFLVMLLFPLFAFT